MVGALKNGPTIQQVLWEISPDCSGGSLACANAAAVDEITSADVGSVCFAVDDQTVAKTDGSSTRSPAGIVDVVDLNGNIWVRFEDTPTSAS
ncbi:hypothetical protein C8N36_114125 [Pelagimonas varians]|uniref:Uncharacterized protein n=1 Tax=Pelagimonas varians TaxID=696760 RepID=A0A238KZU0_9RHOB|nr:hypothetical protein C8N36_114125 [Pelagimonas varians]SMX47722.1 hypothetical protein PEV8663_03623 [Pelagimonas varians]